MILAGVDGCRAGWLAITQDALTGELDALVVRTMAALIERIPQNLIALDIPIGLVETGSRECDRLARMCLGVRGCCVFPAPIISALSAESQQAATQIRRLAERKGVSAQAFGIYKKIREVDELLLMKHHLRTTIFEVHPEVCFAEWHHSPISESKKSEGGRHTRIALIQNHFGAEAFGLVRKRFLCKDVGHDDITDAFACLWTAQRLYDGTAVARPSESVLDSRGIPMRIWS